MEGNVENEIRENLEYDRATGKLFWVNNRGGVLCNGNEAGSIKDGYLRVEIAGKSVYAHRIAWFLHYGAWPEKEIDHINGNPTDNRIENLRDVSRWENLSNMSIHRKGKLVGTKFDKRRIKNPWRSQIGLNGEQKHLGCFSTELEAHLAHMEAYRNIEEVCK